MAGDWMAGLVRQLGIHSDVVVVREPRLIEECVGALAGIARQKDSGSVEFYAGN